MATYQEKLRHPKWQEKRLRILEASGFECSNCGSKSNTLHVHHCYYEKGKSPWEYPDDALRCLCEKCHKSAEDLKLKTSKVVSVTGCEDEIYGYSLGIFCFQNEDEPVSVSTYEQASGLADYWGLNVEEAVLPLLMENDGMITGNDLYFLVSQHCAPEKSHLVRLAADRRHQEKS